MTSTELGLAFEARAAEVGRSYVSEYVEKTLQRRRSEEAERARAREERQERWRREAAELARAVGGAR